jgi:hypothetical protein
MAMINQQTHEQLSKVFNGLGQNLDISKSQYETAVRSYSAVGAWLVNEDSKIALYHPEIMAQGSFLLGTLIKPINDTDDVDIDVVCRLEGKQYNWTQYDLKKCVGDRIKQNDTYRKMLDEEGRRCWTIKYSDSMQFHLDILPSVVSSNYRNVLKEAFSKRDYTNYNELALRITDKKRTDYQTEINSNNWLSSNPFGYARWFLGKCTHEASFDKMLLESVNPVPNYRSEKFLLQRVVQLLKRHRDIMFHGDDEKPISIIITTLAALAYERETNLSQAINNIILKIPTFILEKYDSKAGKNVKWIANPVNPSENFADRWIENPQKERKFYAWLERLRNNVIKPSETGDFTKIRESFSNAFGSNITESAFKGLALGSILSSSTSTLTANVPKDLHVDLPKTVPTQKREGFAL